MKNKIIYRLMTEDVQEVARDVLQRDLTTLEMKSIVDQLTESISWFDIISDDRIVTGKQIGRAHV